MAKAFIGLGSNIGDRRKHLLAALAGISDLGTVTVGSPVYETDPIGNIDQDPFENAVVGLDTTRSARDLLAGLVEIEDRNGRRRDVRWGPRTLDLDLLWYDGQVIAEPELIVPHPRIRDRKFVLAPLVYAAPSLADQDGPYADSLAAVDDQMVRRVTGQLDPRTLRWLAGIGSALELRGSDGTYVVNLACDWENLNGSMFGGYLGAAVLAAAAAEHPDKVPTTLTYRYLRPVPCGGEALLAVEHNRRTDRSADLSVSVWIDDLEYGRAHLSVVTDRGQVVASPAVPQVLPMHRCRPLDELIDAVGQEPGNSVRSWRPLENWDIPDLVDGTSGVVRAWCPNPVEGLDDSYLSAAGLFMAVDALVWPAAMLAAGRLGDRAIYTPTVEISTRFADTERLGGWCIGEARVDHLTTKWVAGTIQVWAGDGRHAATGHSLNLAIG
ncbi:MAG: 2-amino-4-hydroxy-6-hydroxymethyldihydropteridine diphosphokinase [Acidimicrobiia bacterium]